MYSSGSCTKLLLLAGGKAEHAADKAMRSQKSPPIDLAVGVALTGLGVGG